MDHRGHVALITVAAVAAAGAVGVVWWQQHETASAAEAAERDALVALRERAIRLKKSGVNTKELAALFDAARHTPSAGMLPDYCELLIQLSYCTTLLSWQHDPAPLARDLVALHRAVRAAHPEYAFSAADHRNLAEACEHAGDLAGLADAVRDGLAVVGDAQPHEEAMLWVNACRLHSHLGRLDQAQVAVVAARRAMARIDNGSVRSAVGLAEANLCLLDERYDDAARALEDIAPNEPWRELYAAVVAMMRGPRDVAAERVVVACSKQRGRSAQVRRFAASKAVHVALREGDDAAAAARLPTLLALAPIADGDNEGRSATLAIEVALRGGYPCDAALRDDARAAFAAMLRAWRDAPSLPGGIGFLHLDDRATLVANLLRLELRLDGERGAREAFAHVLAAHAASCEGNVPDTDALLGALLGEQHGLLVYVPGRFGSVLLAADRSGIEPHTLARAHELRNAVDKWNEAVDAALAGGSRDALAAHGAKVADALLPAAVRTGIAGWRRLSISGAGQLQNPPFDLMLIATAGRAYALGDEQAIEYLANLPCEAIREPVRQRGGVLFAASLLTTTNHAQPGRFPRDLAAACIDSHRTAGAVTTSLLDTEVTRERVLSGLAGSRIVHLVGHGVFEADREHGNAIQFSDDPTTGCLRGEHLRDQDLRGVIVILSACDAGNAPWRRGGGPLAASLAGAVLAGGARCVLVPTTMVRLENHMRAVSVVHRELAAGTPLAEALLAARRGCRDDAARLELLLMQVHGRGL